MDENYFEKTWGWEIWFANNDLYCGKLLFVKRNEWSSEGKFHYHKIKDETFFIIRGTLLLDYVKDGEFYSITLTSEQSFRVPPKMKHRFTALSDGGCQFIEASTTHREDDSFRCKWDKEKKEWIEKKSS
jgi:mannose-6-phosphate isomerase-like protein (cupin superfamily)